MRCFRLFLPLLFAFAIAPLLAQSSTTSIREIHTVEAGENLFRVGLVYDLFAADVARANGLAENASLAIGQELIIPYLYGTPDAPFNHLVHIGETIDSIATAYALMPAALLSLNGMTEESALIVGSELVIVPGAAAETQSAKTAEEEPAASSETTVDPASLIIGGENFEYAHVVRPGDTVSEIGMRFDLTVSALAQANNLRDAGIISVGQKLVIPGVEPPRFVKPLPDIVTAFTLDPLILEAGRSARITFVTSEAVEVSGTFLDRDLRIVSADAGAKHTILLGIPMSTAKALYPLRLNLRGEAGDKTIEAQLQVIAGAYGYQNITFHDTRLLSPEIEAEERAWLEAAVAAFTPDKRWNGVLSLPTGAAVNAWFGAWRSFNGSAYDRYHHGVDFAAPTGAPVSAAADGTVVAAQALQIRGNTVVIDHGWGLYTAYAHLSDMAHAPGDSVLGGQLIGGIGNTGRSTGPHLHWEVWLHGVNVDPMQWVNETFP